MDDVNFRGVGGEGGGGSSNATFVGSSDNSVLSDKVARALQVRTDTPAMKAALEAFSSAPSSKESNRPSNKSTIDTRVEEIDAKSVRMAIERDALDRTLLLQEELRNLVDTVSKLRQGISDTASIAHHVRDAIYAPVVSNKKDQPSAFLPAAQESSHEEKSEGQGGRKEEGKENDRSSSTKAKSDENNANSNFKPMTEEESFRLEELLASQISDAFLRRDQAKKRLHAVHTFLEKFNLSEQDSRLLDHYNFEDMDSNNAATTFADDIIAHDNNHSKPINGYAFLDALKRTREIRSSLEHTTLDDNRLGASSALRMMESLTQKQEQAYERLYHWIQSYLSLHTNKSDNSNNRMINDSDEDDFDSMLLHPFMKHAMYTLKDVPAFYSHTIELISSSRRQQETKQFLLALTTGYNGLAPIEMRAHDSVSYIGDMLAFCFKVFSVEADVAKGILQYEPDDGSNNNHGDADGSITEKDDNDEEKSEIEAAAEEVGLYENHDNDEKTYTALDMLSVTMSGVSRPLKSRILQVIAALASRSEGGNANSYDDDDDDDDAMMMKDSDDFDDDEVEGSGARSRVTQLYEISGLLLFYLSTVELVIDRFDVKGKGKMNMEDIRSNNPYVAALLECLTECSKAYEATFRVHSAMLDQLSILTGDSEASLAYALITKLTDAHIASPGFSKDVNCSKVFANILGIEFVVETLVETVLANIKSSNEDNEDNDITSDSSPLDDCVTLKRLIMTANKADMDILLSSKLNEKIDEKENYLIDGLVSNESSSVLDLCGLNSLITSYNTYKRTIEESSSSAISMSKYPGLSLDEIEYSIKEFYTSLYSPPLPSLENIIKDPVLRKLARKKIAARVCETYSILYHAMANADAGTYDNLHFLEHTPEQVEQLFTA